MWTELDLSSGQAKHKHFPAVDIMKFILSFMVIAIHIHPFGDINAYLNYGIYNYVARLAVPFFFVAGGYFCFRKTSLDNFDIKTPLSYSKRMLILYLIWTAIYLPISVYNITKSDDGILHSTLAYMRKFLFVGSYTHLWYLLGAAIATAIVCCMINKLGLKTTAIICSILYIVGLFGTSYFRLIKQLENITPIWNLLKLYALVFTTTRNGFFFGTIFVCMGALFAYRKIYMRQSTAIIGFIVSMLVMLIEAFATEYFDLARMHDLYISLVPALFFLFYIITHFEIKETKVTIAMRKYSSIIYFVHLWVNFGISALIKIIELLSGVEIESIHSLLRYILVAIGSLAVAIILNKLQEYKPFRWLKKLL
ncbi:MAG: acyltransferase [Oscillospiraceae bacterium]|nr:acyltransferase [Oscillospiraceae bacterium]